MIQGLDVRRRDIRETVLYREVVRFYEQIHAPGTDRVTDAADIAVRPDGVVAAFTGSIYQNLDRPPEPGVLPQLVIPSAQGRIAACRTEACKEEHQGTSGPEQQ